MEWEIRRLRPEDLEAVTRLFRETIYAVAKNDYTQKQLDHWAAAAEDKERFGQSLMHEHAYVAVWDETVVGFADMTPFGYIDRLYTHKDYQSQGIAQSLMRRLLEEARGLGLAEVTLESSKTGRRFYERFGFRCRGEQIRERRGSHYVNYDMILTLPKKNEMG